MTATVTALATPEEPHDVPSWFPTIVSEKRLAEITGIPRKTLQHWRRQGVGVPCMKINSRVLYDLADVKTYFEQQKESQAHDGNPYAA